MYVSELRLYDFRQFKSVDGKPGLEVRFHPGLNALVGENGSGKTTVVDAMRYVLQESRLRWSEQAAKAAVRHGEVGNVRVWQGRH